MNDLTKNYMIRAALDLQEVIARNPMVLDYLKGVHDAPEDQGYIEWLGTLLREHREEIASALASDYLE